METATLTTIINRVESSLEELRHGKMLILTDHPDRENEGDIIISAEHITSENMNFIIRNSSGIVCLSLSNQILKKFNLNLMVPPYENTSARGTPFTVSIDAKHGITTGVSAADRVATIKCLLDENATYEDIVKPGHIFPLQARDGGVLERQGHTEGALDLVKLAGLQPAAVLCELMNSDGTMMRGKNLIKFAHKNRLSILSIDEIITYRIYKETMIDQTATTTLPLDHYGTFKMSVIKEKISGIEHVVLYKEINNQRKPLLVRIHSSCLTGDLFCSQRCDCHKQLHHSLQRISKEGGMLIYLNQEGRGIGLFNKIKAYALQEQGYDTVEANEKLGLPIDSRQYYIAANILKLHQVRHIRLLTSNPHKIQDLKKYGVENIEIEPMPRFLDEHNQHYLETKKLKLNHYLKDAIYA